MNLLLKRFLKNFWWLTKMSGCIMLAGIAFWLLVKFVVGPALVWLVHQPLYFFLPLVVFLAIALVAFLSAHAKVDLAKEAKDEKAPRKDGPELG